MSPLRSTRQRLEQFLANPACEANVLSAVHGVRMSDVAQTVGIKEEGGMSSYAIRAGVSFEKAIFADDAQRLREQLIKVGLLSVGSTGLLDLRLRQQGGPCRSLDEARQAFDRFLVQLPAGGKTRPTLVAGAAMQLPRAEAIGDGLLAIDVLVVDRDDVGKVSLTLGEIKSYADRGGHTDRAALAAARAQAGLYLHVLRSTLSTLNLQSRVCALDQGFLVLRHVTSNFPKVRYPEELRWQAARAERALERIREALKTMLHEARTETNDRKQLQMIQTAPKAFAAGCLRFCELAKHCYGCSLEKGEPIVLGEDVARLLQGLDLLRVEALLEGAIPANDTEQELVRQFEAAAR
jgi:hypothetical protein